MKKLFCIILLFWPFFGIQAQRQHTISGTVVSRSSGEPLICATVVDVRSGKGTVTNANGRFSLTLPADTVAFRVSYVGYQRFDSLFCLSGNMVMNVSLLSGVQLRAVTVNAERVSSAKSSQISAIEVPMEQIKAVPVLFGETDILKTMQLLPGVQNGTEGMSGVYVRGGGPDENLFLLDGVSLYNVNHLGGFFSAFNSSAVKNVTLYKGSFPARFGGRLSSVLDIATNNGHDKEFHGDISIGAVAAKITLEGPIIKEKTTFSVSYRRTYADLLVKPFMSLGSTFSEEKVNAGYYFYDLNAKVTHKVSDKSRLFASYYMGDDVVYLKVKTNDWIDYGFNWKYWMKMGYNWGNIVGSLRWNYALKPKLFMNITAAYTRYRNNISMGVEEYGWDEDVDYSYQMDMFYKSGIRDLIGRADFDFAPNPDHAIKFGAGTIHHIFTPEVMGMKSEDKETQFGDTDSTFTNRMDTTLGESRVHAEELFCYFEDDWSLTPALKINMGLYASGFVVENKFYPSVQPRISGRLLLSDKLSFKAGYAYMTQYMHLLSNSSINLPTDLWVPVTARIAPMNAHQVAAGLFYNWTDIADFSVEAYYKRMNNLLEYRDGVSFWSSSTNWEDKVCIGRGWSYGLEFLAQRTLGPVSGWVGYTWSRTMRLFDREGMEINNGKPFPAKYDRRHDISIVLMYKPSDRFDVGLTWVYSTGNAATLAMQEFQDEDPDSDDGSQNVYGYVEGRNNFRMPAYHRMDIGVNFHKQKKYGTRTINISVYNLYNRNNPFIVYESGRYHYTNGDVTYRSALVQLSIFPIIPSISYQYKF